MGTCMTRTDYGYNLKIFCVQNNFGKGIIAGFRMEISRYFCMVIENIKNQIHMDNVNGNLSRNHPCNTGTSDCHGNFIFPVECALF